MNGEATVMPVARTAVTDRYRLLCQCCVLLYPYTDIFGASFPPNILHIRAYDTIQVLVSYVSYVRVQILYSRELLAIL